jgi:hypothetical protein
VPRGSVPRRPRALRSPMARSAGLRSPAPARFPVTGSFRPVDEQCLGERMSDGWLVRPLRQVLVERPWLVTAALCLVVLGFGRYGADLPAQEYRTWVVRDHGLLPWSTQWYGGDSLLSYSLLAPVLGAVVGINVLGALAAVVSTALVCRLFPDVEDAGQRWCRLLFAVATVANLVIGRTAFALGLGLGLAALWAAQADQRTLAGTCAVLCSLTSPLVAVFLLLVALAWLPSRQGRRALPLMLAVLGPVVGVVVAHGGGGRFPFPIWHMLILEATAAAGLLWIPRRYAVIRRAVGIYAACSFLLFLIPNAVGGNMLRMATLIAAPLAALAVAGRGRPLAVAAVVALLAGWQLPPVAVAVAGSINDPSASSGYFRPLLAALPPGVPQGRLEIPLTRSHWESYYAARRYPLARGWERQLDVQRNAILYYRLTPASYRRWLDANAVAFIAVPDVPLDPAGQYEADLLQHPPTWLQPVWHNRHWRLWRIIGARALASSPGLVTDLDVSSFTVRFTTAGSSIVRVRWSPLLRIDAGTGCLSRGADGWTRLQTPQAGSLTVLAALPAPLPAWRGEAPLRCR